MEILFAKSNLPFSKLIRNVTNEPVSHCVIRAGSYVVHSDFSGVRIETLKDLQARAEIVYRIKIPTNYGKLFKIFAKHQDDGYDYGAFFFVGLSLFLRSFLKLPLPKSNLWQSSGMYLCTEWVSQYVEEQADSMITPYKLYLKLRDKPNS